LKRAKRLEAVSEMIKEQLSGNNPAAFRVISDSMEPFIRIGDQVVIESVKSTKLKPGDIILYFNGSRFCTHRLVYVIKESNITKFVTKGDRLFGFDIPFNKEKYLGSVIKIQRNDIIIDLSKNKYRLFNTIMGKILTLQWLVFNTGLQAKCTFRFNSNVVTRLLKKIIFVFFNWFIVPLENFLLKTTAYKDK